MLVARLTWNVNWSLDADTETEAREEMFALKWLRFRELAYKRRQIYQYFRNYVRYRRIESVCR